MPDLDRATPLFMIGAPRSGTTFVARILNAHPAILITHETAVFMQLAEMIRKSEQGARAGILYGKEYHELWAKLLRSEAPRLISRYYAEIARAEEKGALKYWGEKHPHLNACLDFLQELYPNAHYVYVVRDPRDTALSIAAMNSIPFDRALDSWLKFSERFEDFVAHLPAARVSLVKYEPLISDHAGQVERLLGSLGLPMDEAVERFIETYKNKDSHRIKKNRPEQLENRDYANTSLHRFRDELDADAKADAVKKTSEFLEKYSYELQ